MENINKTPSTTAMGISIFTTVVLFILVLIGVQIIVPAYVFDTSTYYVLSILLELIPLGIGVWLYLVISGQHPSDIVSFNKPQVKMNKQKMFRLIILGAVMALGGSIFIRIVQLGWISLLEVLGYNLSDAMMPAVDNVNVLIWATLGVAVTPAIMEELVFRGILQKGLLRNAKPRTAIILSSILFMLMHLSVEQMAFTFLCGLLLGYMAYKSGSILPSMAFHFVNNLIVVITLYSFDEIAENSANATQLGISDVTILISTVVFVVISLAILIFAIWRFNKVAQAPPENPYLKPMKPVALMLLVLSGCILFLVMTVFAVLQNAVPM